MEMLRGYSLVVEAEQGLCLALKPMMEPLMSYPDASGELQIFGSGGISVTGQGPGRTVTISLTGGGIAVEQVNVDFNTAPGTDPVVPSATGEIQIYGNSVSNGTNANAPVATHSRAANQFHIDVQLSAAVSATPADPYDAGICSFDDSQFSVDANGFVQLAGGGLAIDQINVDANTAPGTDPVVPDASGEISVAGAAVSAHSVPVETHSRAANAYNVEVQVASDRTGAPGNTNDAGLASFSDVSFLTDADGYTQSLTGTEIGVSNLGISYSGGTFTVHGYDGTALSASNPATIWMNPNTGASAGGQLKKYTLTANQTFQDDAGTSDIVGNLFGTTTSVAWGLEMPMYLYAVANNDPGTNSEPEVAICLCRVPHRVGSPLVGTIGDPSSAVADTDASMWSIQDITEADYASQPCLCIGSIRMTKSASDDWTVQTVSTVVDGIGRFQERGVFSMVQNQNGASASAISSSVGGDTLPTFANVGAVYQITKEGLVQYLWNFNAVSGAGVGTGNLRVHIPLSFRYVSARFCQSGYVHFDSTNSDYDTGVPYANIGTSAFYYVNIIKSGANTAAFSPPDFTTSPQINNGSFVITYPATLT